MKSNFEIQVCLYCKTGGTGRYEKDERMREFGKNYCNWLHLAV